ncbi:MAG: L-rhamnose isomerase [Oscillospiraceae bacterium]|nr:L-rhamnose isomerase [Oscillospiraceae bacterium]
MSGDSLNWERSLREKGLDLRKVKGRVKGFRIETPSWGYADSGTRFKVFKQQGMPRTLEEKLEDAGQVHKFTGVCPTVAIHIPWDKCDDYGKAKAFAKDLGLAIGAVNPNVFQEPEYMLGSVVNPDAGVRRRATEHLLECAGIARLTGSRDLSLWMSDGTNYPGQADFRQRKAWMEESLIELDKAMDDGMRMLIEYKTFEPSFYHTDIADWGMAYVFAGKVGDKAEVLVDLGHHPLGSNIEHIVAFLLDEGKLGGFHFNNKKYADDDLIVGSVNPYELFLIFTELVKAEDDPATSGCAGRIAYMIDQSHCIEPKIPAMIRSVLNIQEAHAKALLVDRGRLAEAQGKGDVLAAEACVKDAFDTDVRPLLAEVREEMGIDPDPMGAYLRSGYEKGKLARG